MVGSGGPAVEELSEHALLKALFGRNCRLIVTEAAAARVQLHSSIMIAATAIEILPIDLQAHFDSDGLVMNVSRRDLLRVPLCDHLHQTASIGAADCTSIETRFDLHDAERQMWIDLVDFGIRVGKANDVCDVFGFQADH